MKLDATFHEEGKPRSNGWQKFKQLYDSIPDAINHEETQKSLAAGARVMARFIRNYFKRATTSEYRNDPRKIASKEKRYPGFRSLVSSIAGKQGTLANFPSAFVKVVGKGARQYWLVDQGHAGPKKTSKRTPAHPSAFDALNASENPRDEAILKKYRELFPQIVNRVKRMV